jgi:hypothetical protein
MDDGFTPTGTTGTPRRLAIRCLPGRDETLHSWLIRSAVANAYSSQWQVLELVRNSPQPDVRARLAELVDCSTREFDRYVIDEKMMFHGGELLLPHRRFSIHPKVCPLCLTQRARLRSVWNLQFWSYCPTRQCSLIGDCPFCGRRLTKRERYIGHCGNTGCDANLSEAKVRRMPRVLSSIVGLLGDLANHKRGQHFPELPTEFDDLLPGRYFGPHSAVEWTICENRSLRAERNAD